MHRNPEESARHTVFPRFRELDCGNSGKNVDADWSNPNLIDHLFPGECFRRDSIRVEGSPEFPECSYQPASILCRIADP